MAVGLFSLPIEIRILILHQLWDVGDLTAAVASQESLAEAFANCSTLNLVAALLRNEIDSRLWPLAVTIWQIRTSREQYVIFHGRDAWEVLRDCHAENPDSAWDELCRVGLDEARQYFHDLHQAIQHFTFDFLSQAIKCLTAGSSGKPHIPTSSEIYRVQRSFYYYELFCLIWGNGQRKPADWDSNISWGLYVEFSPWMSEQVASVHEYLLRKLCIAFDKMAVQDMELGKGKSPQLDTLDHKNFISWGIQHSLKLTDFSNYEEWHRALDEKRNQPGWFLLPPALEELNWDYYRDYPLESPDYMQKIQEVDEDDSGPGPALLWCSAHSADDGKQFILGPDYAVLRRAGYVMWDAERRPMLKQLCQSKNFCCDTLVLGELNVSKD